ncbi:MAG: N-acetylmuramoyl-L-alanine amidase [Propionibacteriaceae bacterium]|nr:N-acetylmuramoyl-L-alanine amidase [Propionibacteriaceae bacterium]
MTRLRNLVLSLVAGLSLIISTPLAFAEPDNPEDQDVLGVSIEVDEENLEADDLGENYPEELNQHEPDGALLEEELEVFSVETSSTTEGLSHCVSGTPAKPMKQFTLGADMNGDGRGEILAVDTKDALWAFQGTENGTLGQACRLGLGFGPYRIYGPGDITGDGYSDILAISPDGVLWLFPGNDIGPLGPRLQVGWGWQGWRLIPSGDLNGDGKPDLLGINSLGELYMYAGKGDGFFESRIKVGWGWNGWQLHAGGDLDGDGQSDILGINPLGELYQYLGKGTGNFQSRQKVGWGWSGWQLGSGADLTGDGHADLTGCNASTKTLFFYGGKGKGEFASRRQIDTNWQCPSGVVNQSTSSAPSGFSLTISGVPVVTQELTANVAIPEGWVVASYQWYRGSTAISGATQSTYIVTTADLRNSLSVHATASREGYTGASATSPATAQVVMNYIVHVDQTKLMNKHYTVGRTKKIDKIIIHHNAGNLTIDQVWNVWQTREASAHYQVQNNGKVGRLVGDGNIAWHAGNWPANETSIGIEHANNTSKAPWTVSDAAIDSGAKLVAELSIYYGLGRPVWNKTVYPHSYFAATACPGELKASQNAKYMARAQYWYDTLIGAI